MQKPAVSVNENRHDHGAVDRCHETLSGKWTADQRQHQSGGVKADQQNHAKDGKNPFQIHLHILRKLFPALVKLGQTGVHSLFFFVDLHQLSDVGCDLRLLDLFV